MSIMFSYSRRAKGLSICSFRRSEYFLNEIEPHVHLEEQRPQLVSQHRLEHGMLVSVYHPQLQS